jgi:uncharacterized protein YndB with AHSA1/START domain
MGDFSLTVAIEQPPAAVFVSIAEPTNMPRWYDAIDHVAVTPRHGVGLGATFEIARSLPGGRATNLVEIVEYEPTRRVTFESRRGPTPFRYRYTLEPTATGTLLTLDGRITSEGLTGPATHLQPLVTQLFKRGMKHNLDVLKALVESKRHARTQGSPTRCSAGACPTRC